jgi:hypothetical protein
MRSRCLVETRDSLRDLCFCLYNFNLSSLSGRQTQDIPGWSLIRREAAIQATIKHHMAILDNLKDFQWASTDTNKRILSASKGSEKRKSSLSDLTKSISFLKIKLGELKNVFGDQQGQLPHLK